MADKPMAVQHYIRNPSIQGQFEKLLKNRASQFTTSLLSVVNSNEKLAECTPETVVSAALTAASLDLPINQNLGFAYIVPYNNKKKDENGKDYWVQEAQFQMGYKGFIQLAQRSGQYKTISSTPVYEGQLISIDPLRGIVWDWSVEAKGDPIGYAAYFELLNGFEKTLYMTKQEMSNHGKKFSQTFKKGFGLWVDDFESMALKTVIKLLISKFGPLSTELQQALQFDQSVVKDDDIVYIDNDQLDSEKATDEEKQEILEAHAHTS